MNRRQLLQLVLLGALWGASFLFTRISVGEFGPAWLVWARVTAGALFLSGAAALLRQPLQTKGNTRHFLTLGFLNTALPFLLFAYAATTLSASLLSIINSTAPFWGVIFGIVLTRQPPRKSIFAGLLAGSTGVTLLVTGDPSALAAETWQPVLAAVSAPICYGLASHYARARTAHIEPFAAAHGSMWGAVSISVPVLLTVPPPIDTNGLQLSAGSLGAALALGILCTGLAYLIYFRLIREVGAASALTVTFLIPLFGILWGALFLGEPVTGGTLLGAAFVLVGTGLVTGVIIPAPLQPR